MFMTTIKSSSSKARSIVVHSDMRQFSTTFNFLPDEEHRPVKCQVCGDQHHERQPTRFDRVCHAWSLPVRWSVMIRYTARRTAAERSIVEIWPSVTSLLFCIDSLSGSWVVRSEWVSRVLRPHQHSIGYPGDGFYRSKDPTNSIKVLKEMLQKRKKRTKTTKYIYT